MIVDIHAHLIAIRPEHGSKISRRLLRGPSYPLLTRLLGLGEVGKERLDEAYADRLIAWAELSDLDALGVLAFDGVYDERGQLDHERTQLMVGNDYCLEVCARSTKLWPICSINPRRADAIDELERVVEAGAVAIKTLPNSQGFDPANPAHATFWRRMAALEIPLLTHTSFEHTVPPIDQRYGDPERLIPALCEGVRVIAAHCAGAGTAHPVREDFDTWLSMLETYENLWGDISAMASVSRFQYIHRVLESPLARQRVVLGSDFPIPVTPIVFLPQLGLRRVRLLQKIHNPLQRNLEVFRALGVEPAILSRGAELLRHPGQ